MYAIFAAYDVYVPNEDYDSGDVIKYLETCLSMEIAEAKVRSLTAWEQRDAGIKEISCIKVDGKVFRLMNDKPIELVTKSPVDIKAQALAKLSYKEKKALGYA